MKFKENQQYTCVASKSPGYKLGQVYTTYKDADGKICFKGDDGYEDNTAVMVSKFTEFIPSKAKRLGVVK